jgi:hypothetical protein
MLETIAAIGGLASGLGKLFGSKGKSAPAQPSLDVQLATQSAHGIEHERKAFDQKMTLAKQHGLHPLSVLGVPMSTFSPAITGSSGGGSDVDYSSLGDGVSQIAKSFVKPPDEATPEVNPNVKRLEDANVRIAEANAKRSEWEALRSEWTAADLLRGQAGAPPAVRMSNDASVTRSLAAAQAGVSPALFGPAGVDVKQQITPPHPSLLGHSLGADQSFQRMVDKDGHLYSTPNPNVYNPDIENFGTFHYLSNKYGTDKALNVMAALEQAPLVGGVFSALGAAGYGAYRYFGNQRREAEKRIGRNIKGQSWRGRASRGSD